MEDDFDPDWDATDPKEEDRREEKILAEGKVVLSEYITELETRYAKIARILDLPDSCFENTDPYAIQCRSREDWEYDLSTTKDRLEDYRRLAADHRRIAAIEAFANEVKQWKDEDSERCRYPWAHIALSILQHPGGVEFDYATCQVCGASTVKIHFCSPAWTWRHDCAVAGNMTICPHCKSQSKFFGPMIRT